MLPFVSAGTRLLFSYPGNSSLTEMICISIAWFRRAGDRLIREQTYKHTRIHMRLSEVNKGYLTCFLIYSPKQIHAYNDIHTHKHKHIHAHTHIHIYTTHTYIYTHMHTHTYMHTCIHTQTVVKHTHTYTYIYSYIHACIHTYTSIFTRLTPGKLKEFCRSHADLSYSFSVHYSELRSSQVFSKRSSVIISKAPD